MNPVGPEVIITSLLNFYKNELIKSDHFTAVEAQYGFNKRKADLLLLNGLAHAFEVKSDFDDLRRLKEQTLSYRQNFELVTIVTTDKFIKKIQKTSPKTVGLAIFKNNEIRHLRKPKTQSRLSKFELAASCKKTQLEKALLKKLNPKKSYNLPYYDICELASKALTTSELKALRNQNFVSRYSHTNSIFKSHIGQEIHVEDIELLKRKSEILELERPISPQIELSKHL